MSTENIFAIVMLITVFIASCSQVMLKKSALITYRHKWQMLLNPYVISAYAIFLLSTLIAVYSLKYLPLITLGFIECSAYVYILLLDRIFFEEEITTRKLLGTVLIIFGIFICL